MAATQSLLESYKKNMSCLLTYIPVSQIELFVYIAFTDYYTWNIIKCRNILEDQSLKNESAVSSAMSYDEHPSVAITVCSPH